MRRLPLRCAVALVTVGDRHGGKRGQGGDQPGQGAGARAEPAPRSPSSPGQRKVTAARPSTCGTCVTGETSTGSAEHTDGCCCRRALDRQGVTDLAVAGNRVALARVRRREHAATGYLYTATSTSPSRARTGVRNFTGLERSSPIVLGVASSSVMPYSIGSTVKVLQANGAKAYTWQAPGQVTNTTAYQRTGRRVREGREVLRPLAGRRR